MDFNWTLPNKITFFERDFICLFICRGEGREKERERNIDVERNIDWLHLTHPTKDLAHNPGTSPDRELSW